MDSNMENGTRDDMAGATVSGMARVNHLRKALVHQIFPAGLPKLWCPLLTHYHEDLSLDRQRMSMHIRSLRPWVSAFLAPGSTGDGWELAADETDSLLDFLLTEAADQDFSLMVGILRKGQGEALDAIHSVLARFNAGDPGVATLSARRICGFTVTPPKGSMLAQDLILKELRDIAETGVPLAIYQLPQITENEMSPETVASLASRYPNLYLLKDTSGQDRIALSGIDCGNLFMVRGAEGGYSRWLKSDTASKGGNYDGFLLSTANCFAKELSAILDFIALGKVDEAEVLSVRVSAVVEGAFSEAAKLGFGNPFSNANKAMDHYRAWGSHYASVPLPVTRSGNRLPMNLIEEAVALMDHHGFGIEKGYME
jgi:dihydrodipicolinate synthase/N-acetylneuraminate lyase